MASQRLEGRKRFLFLILIFLLASSPVRSLAEDESPVDQEELNSNNNNNNNNINNEDEQWCIQQTHDIFSHLVDAVSDHVETMHGTSGGNRLMEESDAKNGNVLQKEIEALENSQHNDRRLIRLWRKRRSLKGLRVVQRLWKDRHNHRQRILKSSSDEDFSKEASEQNNIGPASEKNNSHGKQPKNKPGRVRRIWSRVKKVFRGGTSTSDATASSMNKPSKNDKELKSKRKAFENFRYYSKFDMEEVVAGAKLLSGSFQLLSNTAGFLADTVRVSGDTTAGIVGSSVKVIGTAVKSAGNGLSSASRRLDRNSSAEDSSAGEESNNQQHPFGRGQRKKKYGNIGKHTRRVAAKSVKLVGSVVGGLGESLLIAGVAAESLAASTAGVAEETVRILENLAGTISVAISFQSRRKRSSKGNGTATDIGSPRKTLSPYYLSFGTYEEMPAGGDSTAATKARSMDDILELMEILVGDAGNFWTFVSSDIDDVPSMATELLVALVLCYLATLVILPAPNISSERTEKKLKPSLWFFGWRFGFFASNERISVRDGKNMENEKRPTKVSKRRPCRYITKKIILAPFRILKWFLGMICKAIFNRHVALFTVYALIWTYISQLSQERALLIQRYVLSWSILAIS